MRARSRLSAPHLDIHGNLVLLSFFLNLPDQLLPRLHIPARQDHVGPAQGQLLSGLLPNATGGPCYNERAAPGEVRVDGVGRLLPATGLPPVQIEFLKLEFWSARQNFTQSSVHCATLYKYETSQVTSW
jgi:hypothetical protein